MAFQEEDGTGLSTSNAYGSVAGFKTHHNDRGQDIVGITDPTIQQGLINGADYIDKRFGRDFRGYRMRNTQAMEFPRVSAVDISGYLIQGVPAKLKMATYEYAWLWCKLERNLAPPPANEFPTINPEDQTTVESAGMVTGKSETVGPISESAQYGSSSTNRLMVSSGSVLTQHIPEYPQADLWIEFLLDSGNQELGRG